MSLLESSELLSHLCQRLAAALRPRETLSFLLLAAPLLARPQSAPPPSELGTIPSQSELDTIMDGLNRYYDCVFTSGPGAGCALTSEKKQELQGKYFELLTLLDDENLRMSNMGYLGSGTPPAAFTAPDLVDDGSFTDGQGIDSWDSGSPNIVVLNNTLTGNFLCPCVYGAILFHEASHFDDAYSSHDGQLASPGDACLFAFEEVRARKLEYCLLECCSELCDAGEGEQYAIGLRLGNLSGWILDAENECEDVCGVCPPTSDCDQ
jgi:hypothetical protein